MHVIGVACGMARSLVNVDRSNMVDRLEQVKLLATANKTPKKKTTPAKANEKKRKSEEEEASDVDSDSSEEANRRVANKQQRGGKASRGRGRGKGGSQKALVLAPGRTGKRGRPRKSS